MKCLITGATRGIGRAAALELAKQGHELVVIARDPARAEELVGALRAVNGEAKISSMLCDLSSLAEIRRLAEEVKAQHPSLDVLINNAGGMFPTRKTTVDGFEMTFAVNHLAYFLLTQLLRDHIKQRVVSVSSGAHSSAHMNFDDLMGEKRYGGLRNYAQSKLANILFTRELARRLPSGVTANCLHPGFVDSNFGHDESALLRFGLFLAKPFMISTEAGADTLVYLSSSPEVAGVTGEYYFRRKIRRGSAASQDVETAKRLWEVSEKLTGITS